MRNTTTRSHSQEEAADLRDLTTALEQLRLAQQRVDSVRQRIENRSTSVQRITATREEAVTSSTAQRTRRRTVHPLASYVVGDYVRVKNPKADQEDRGTVFGATRSALVRVRTSSGQEIKRLSKNLVLLESADERERAELARTRGAATTEREQSQ